MNADRPTLPDDAPAWVADAYRAIRAHPVTPETTWLVGTAATLAYECCAALVREDRLHDRLAELELRLASTLDSTGWADAVRRLDERAAAAGGPDPRRVAQAAQQTDAQDGP